MINVQNAAKQAVTEAEKRIEGTLGVSDVEAAKEYVDMAISTLESESGGYDPDTLATDLARSAVVEYAKARLLGQEPQNASSFVRAKQRWGKVAAAEYHKQGHRIG